VKAWKTVAVEPQRAQALAAATDWPEPLIRALLARGLETPDAIDRYLKPRLSELSDPFLLPQMDAAVARIWQARQHGESVAVYGDYDADGITSAALLLQVLTRIGVRATPYLPNRLDEGYGLSIDALDACIADCHPRLVITTDCGTGAGAAVRHAAARGIDVIVTDHHEITGELAPALAVINPKRAAALPGQALAGVGVVFKLAHALVKAGRDLNEAAAGAIDLRDLLDLVAIGTVADIAPLTGENRVLVRHGLARLNATPCVGLRALIEIAAVKPPVDTYHVGFMIGPRMNAVGRLGNARKALELLLTEHDARARSLAAELDAANRERKRLEDDILEAARSAIDAEYDPARDFGLVAAAPDWHAGVIGIVAARLCSRYQRPVIVIALDGDGRGRGSGRSIPEFNLVDGLRQCAAHLTAYGGHDRAAGLELEAGAVTAFTRQFCSVCAERLSGRDLRPVQRIDAWLELSAADEPLMAGIDLMRPLGEGNPEPVWGARSVTILGQPRVVGGSHLKLTVAQGNRQMDAIGFGMGDRPVPAGPIDVAFTLERNNYRGYETLQMKLKDFRPSGEDGQREPG
jgi:single-stranded-DNA-specific exonuclease